MSYYAKLLIAAIGVAQLVAACPANAAERAARRRRRRAKRSDRCPRASGRREDGREPIDVAALETQLGRRDPFGGADAVIVVAPPRNQWSQRTLPSLSSESDEGRGSSGCSLPLRLGERVDPGVTDEEGEVALGDERAVLAVGERPDLLARCGRRARRSGCEASRSRRPRPSRSASPRSGRSPRTTTYLALSRRRARRSGGRRSRRRPCRSRSPPTIDIAAGRPRPEQRPGAGAEGVLDAVGAADEDAAVGDRRVRIEPAAAADQRALGPGLPDQLAGARVERVHVAVVGAEEDLVRRIGGAPLISPPAVNDQRSAAGAGVERVELVVARPDVEDAANDDRRRLGRPELEAPELPAGLRRERDDEARRRVVRLAQGFIIAT